jgi:beta-lactamase superfamily II metal-dependent hydrolase
MTGRLDPRHRDRRLLVLFVLALGAPIAAGRPPSPGQATQVVNGAVVPAQRLPPATLDIYFIDTEGGKATLFVSPTGQILLFDTGTGGDNNRDADRITNLVKSVAVEPQIDHVIVSHYHGDHVGNAAELSRRLPIRHFYDHGAWTVEGQPNRRAAFDSYLAVRATAHATVPKPGTRIGVTGFDFTIVSGAGELVTAPIAGMPGAGAPNQHCRDFVPRVQDATPENAEAIGAVVRYGSFTLLDLSDLIWNLEKDLVCPNNLLGTVDVYHTSRHGTDWAGNPVMVHAVRPRVAVMNNGVRKGGTRSTFEILRTSPGLLDVWQLHYSEDVSKETNSQETFIANLEGTPGHQGHYIKLSARTDGSFTITNERNGFTKEYPARGARSSPTAAAKP